MNGYDMTNNVKRLPFADAAPDYPPPDWRAAWIWTADPTEGRHDYVCFRRTFDLTAVPGCARLRLAAQRDATLWVNGEKIAHGPPISDPRFQRYETFDVATLLRRGQNVVAVRVYHGSELPSGPFTALAGTRGLLCQLDIDGAAVAATDAGWRARRSRAYLTPPVHAGDSMLPEWFDARQNTPGWIDVGFDDAAWPAAVPVIAAMHGLWCSAQPQARFFPWVNLIPSETRPLRRERLRPAAVAAVGEVLQRREASPHDAAARMSLEPILPLNKAVVIHAESLVSGEGAVTIRNSPPDEPHAAFDGLRNATLVLDFGRLVNARLGLRLNAAAGCVDIGYAYRLEDGRVAPYVSSRTPMADHYIARSGEQVWETADWRHFRYVQLTFRNLAGECTLHEIWAEATGNVFEPRGRFQCDDPPLNRLFDTVRRTTDLSVVDRTMDNPSRERKQYLGDCSSIVPAITGCFGDAALLRRYFLNAAEGQHATGLYRYSYPGHDNDGTSLFDHSLSLPLRLWEHDRLFADRELVKAMWPGLERFLQLAASCVSAEGLMALPPYAIWFDWGHMDRRGFFLPLQAMSAEVFRCSAELAEAIGESGEAWRGLHRRLLARIPDWFDSGRGVFVDAIVDGQRQAHCSEHGNSLVAYWRLAPDAMIGSALDRWAADPEAFGRASPAWHYLPGAFIRAGRPDLAIRWMRETCGILDRRELDTWPETWCLYGEKTAGFWRCRNSRAVAQGAGLGGIPTALLQGLCGILPAEPGFGAVHLRPQPGPLARLGGTQPGPDGDYTLELEKRAEGWRLRFDMPSPRRVLLDAAFAPEARHAVVDGRRLDASETVTLPGGLQARRFVWDAAASSVVEIDVS